MKIESKREEGRGKRAKKRGVFAGFFWFTLFFFGDFFLGAFFFRGDGRGFWMGDGWAVYKMMGFFFPFPSFLWRTTNTSHLVVLCFRHSHAEGGSTWEGGRRNGSW